MVAHLEKVAVGFNVIPVIQCVSVCVNNVHKISQGTKSYTLLQITIIVIINLILWIIKGVFVTKTLQEPQY